MFKPSNEALAWLRNYHGSIDSTALLLAFEAGRRTEAHADDCDGCNLCDETLMDLDPMEKYLSRALRPEGA